MAVHRPTKKEMNRDELVNTVAQLSEVAERHARSLAVAAGAIVVLIVAVSLGLWFSRSRALEADRKLAAVQTAAAAPTADLGQVPNPGVTGYATSQQKYEEVLRLAEVVLTEHPSSEASRWAAYWKGIALNELGRRDEALSALQPLISGGEETLSATSRMLQARIQEAKGDLDAAAGTYEALANAAPPRFPAELALMNQARVLEAQGKMEAARAAWKRVTQEFPESPISREASKRLAPNRG